MSSSPVDETTLSMATMEQPENEQQEQEEKARLITQVGGTLVDNPTDDEQVLELQNTLEDLSCRVDNVKEENLRLRSENQVQ